MGVSPKWVKSKRRRGKKRKRREREGERLNDGNNNGQAMHGARKHAWRTQAAWAKINFFPLQSGITVYILLYMENVIWNQI